MDNEKILKEATKILGINDVGPEIYKDLLQPAVRETGKNLLTIAKAVTVAMSPLKGAIWGFDKIQNWLGLKLTEKLSRTDPRKIQTPKMNIAGPILLQLPFCKDEPELREMYANLLASAMDRDKSTSAHPSFTTIIQQLSSDEALILKWISENYEFEYSILFNSDSIHEIIDEFESLCKSVLSESFDESKLILYQAYLDNLQRLRLLEVREIRVTSPFTSVYGSSTYVVHPVDTSETKHIGMSLCVTDFGAKFLEICIGDPPIRKAELDCFVDVNKSSVNSFTLKIKNIGNRTAEKIKIVLFIENDLKCEIADYESGWENIPINEKSKYIQAYSRIKPIEFISPQSAIERYAQIKIIDKLQLKALEESRQRNAKLNASLKIIYDLSESKEFPFSIELTLPEDQ